MSMTKLHWQVLLLFIAIIIIFSSLLTDKYAFFYGVFVGLVNLGLSYWFLYRNQQHIATRQGQTLSELMKSMVVRFVIVGGLLVFGFVQLEIDAASVVVGFIFGQIYYLFNQLIGIVKHGK